jgi:hypothetical protein
MFGTALEWKIWVYFMVIWYFTKRPVVIFKEILYILCSFCYIFPVLVRCTVKNLATLLSSNFARKLSPKNGKDEGLGVTKKC